MEKNDLIEVVIENKIDYAPKISVIIPVYNTEKYLRECLDSVVNQTLKEIEIICVNDGSTDASLDILKEYAEKDNRIKVISQLNQGAGIARNVGIEYATGKYLSILDGDDIFDFNMLEIMYDKSENTNADILICRCQGVDAKNNQIIDMHWSLKFIPNKEVFNYMDFLPNHVFSFCVGWSWDKLYKTSFIRNTKLKFQGLRSTNDAYFVFLSICLAKSISIVENIFITHRKNTGTQLSETRDRDCICFIQAIRAIKETLIELKMYAEVKQSFLSWVVHFCFWQIKTLKDDRNKIYVKKIVGKEFNNLGIYELDKDFFYDANIYKIIKNFRTEISIRKKLLHHLFSISNKQSSNGKWHKIIYILGVKISLRNKRKEKRLAVEQEKKFIHNNLNKLAKKIETLSKQNGELCLEIQNLKNKLEIEKENAKIN